jgi:hypothetical protein
MNLSTRFCNHCTSRIQVYCDHHANWFSTSHTSICPHKRSLRLNVQNTSNSIEIPDQIRENEKVANTKDQFEITTDKTQYSEGDHITVELPSLNSSIPPSIYSIVLVDVAHKTTVNRDHFIQSIELIPLPQSFPHRFIFNAPSKTCTVVVNILKSSSPVGAIESGIEVFKTSSNPDKTKYELAKSTTPLKIGKPTIPSLTSFLQITTNFSTAYSPQTLDVKDANGRMESRRDKQFIEVVQKVKSSINEIFNGYQTDPNKRDILRSIWDDPYQSFDQNNLVATIVKAASNHPSLKYSLLSLIIPELTYANLHEQHPSITRFIYDESAKHRNLHGAGSPFESIKRILNKKSSEIVQSLIQFILNECVVHSSYGMKIVKFSNGLEQIIPKLQRITIRTALYALYHTVHLTWS